VPDPLRSYPVCARGGGSSVGRAPGCGPGGRGFESPPPPLESSDLGGASIRREVTLDQGVDELLLCSNQLDPVALELLGTRADRAHRLALVDQAPHFVAKGLDRWKLDDHCVYHDASDCRGKN
jgi:hypothetical protein